MPSLPVRCAALLVLPLLAACAATPESGDETAASDYDRFESMNRAIYRFNDSVDSVTTEPLAKGYRKVTPQFVRRGISNFFDNLVTPRSALANFLQGQAGQGFNEAGRFFFNSTLGLGGLIDIAELGGMPTYEEDFSQTFAAWGLPDGPYLMLPFLGPSTVLDAIAMPLDYVTDLRRHIPDAGTRDRLLVLSIIDTRYRLLAADALLEDANDPYITLREAFRQNREYEIYDGDPPAQDEYFEFDEDEF
ncbi:MAG: VacJ family lipoprotein [Woeseiaceae bacterium]|nr:VacJ family lipoprotein [Woeseiaceae bacterium]